MGLRIFVFILWKCLEFQSRIAASWEKRKAPAPKWLEAPRLDTGVTFLCRLLLGKMKNSTFSQDKDFARKYCPYLRSAVTRERSFLWSFSFQGLGEDNPYTFFLEEHLWSVATAWAGLWSSAHGLWGSPWASAEEGNHQPCSTNQLQSQSDDIPLLNPNEWDETQGNQAALISQMLLI